MPEKGLLLAEPRSRREIEEVSMLKSAVSARRFRGVSTIARATVANLVHWRPAPSFVSSTS
jgi:hypothetical protein